MVEQVTHFKCFICKSRTLIAFANEYYWPDNRLVMLCNGCVNTAIREAIIRQYQLEAGEWLEVMLKKGHVRVTDEGIQIT